MALTIPHFPASTLPGGEISIFFVSLIALSIIFHVILNILLRIVSYLVGKTKNTLDDRLLGVLGKYFPALAVITAFWLAGAIAFGEGFAIGSSTGFDIYLIALLAVLGIMLSALADSILVWYGLELQPSTDASKKEETVFPFVRNIVKIAILVLFFIFILQRLGFDTTAIITGLGVGGLAVALALQDTLGNMFGGIHILIDKPFREGQYIKMDNGPEGSVMQIGWRTTRILTPANTEVVIPNSKLAGSILENYSKPDQETSVSYSIGVDYKEDVDKVEKLLIEALNEASGNCNLIVPHSIATRFDSFGDYTLNFKFSYLVRGYQNRFVALKEANRQIFYTFKKNKINIPFPVRTVYNLKQ